jgi:para-nitrobenzyl esterase
MEKVRTGDGFVSGSRENGIRSYLGIPFAAPPLGELRWREPHRVQPWKDVRPCTEYRSACPQPASELYDVGDTDEDCLYLNVWTPARNGDEALPVMVWIHGGAFLTGSGSLDLYNGEKLASRGVIVVTINYRLGPFGFLAHPLLSKESPRNVSGNYGLQDQLAALRWVHDNIGSFGGDPGCVTVFGESAGAVSICDLMVSPLAKGMFHRAIVESGPLWVKEGLPASCHTLDAAEHTGEELTRALACEKAGNIVDALRAKTPDEILDGAGCGEGFLQGGLQFGPVIDGWLLPDRPTALLAHEAQYDLPVIVGSNADEANLFLKDADLPAEKYISLVRSVFGDDADKALAIFPVENQENVRKTLGKLVTTMEFTAPARFLARSMRGKESGAFLYRFLRFPPGDPLGACHGVEIPYVFGNLDLRDDYQGEDRDISSLMMDYWTTFAGKGDPCGAGLPDWPAYDSGSDLCLQIGDEVALKPGPYGEACDLAEKTLA